METSAYIKTWTGVLTPQSSYESAGLPRGGGWGSVRNILFSNFQVFGADNGPTITEDSGDNGTSPGTSKMEISNIVSGVLQSWLALAVDSALTAASREQAFVNFTGYLSGNEEADRTVDISCSNVHPCFNIAIENVSDQLRRKHFQARKISMLTHVSSTRSRLPWLRTRRIRARRLARIYRLVECMESAAQAARR